MTGIHKNLPRGTSVKATKVARRVLKPIERFLKLEAASGLVLLTAMAAALLWANLHNDSYESVWTYEVGFAWDALSFGEAKPAAPAEAAVAAAPECKPSQGCWKKDLRWWINDGLMTFFFFLIGLELRREFAHGELAKFKSATLPIVAAIGGMAAPALIYLYFNQGLPTDRGWGIPMGTDTAFALGILAILGRRVPAAARILLLASAVIDDVGAILVIALFYTDGLQYVGLLVGVVAVGVIWVMKNLGVRGWPYVVPGLVLWIGVLNANVHPTLAGVVLGFMTPALAGYTPSKLMELAGPQHQSLHRLSKEDSPSAESMLGVLLSLRSLYREGISFVDQLIHKLHGPVAFFVIPVFVLANAGVELSNLELPPGTETVFWGIALGLLIGKPFGIFTFSFIAIKTGFSKMPQGMRFRGILLVGLVSAIGFTMAIFISQLAFTPAVFGDSALAFQKTSKLAILAASFVAALSALLIGYLRPKVHPPPGEEA